MNTNKQIEYKPFQLKYENTKLLNFEKYESVSSVLAVFTSTYYLCDLQEKRHQNIRGTVYRA